MGRMGEVRGKPNSVQPFMPFRILSHSVDEAEETFVEMNERDSFLLQEDRN